MWPGNTADVTTLLPVKERLQKQFGVERVGLVADRGMISKETLEKLDEQKWPYILGVRMRQDPTLQAVLEESGPWEEVHPKSPRRKDPSPLKVREATLAGRRLVICLNEDQAAKDRHDREAIVAGLEDALKQGDKALIGNKGYRRFVRATGERFEIDQDKVAAEARYDGLWVLTTNMELSAREVALKYKQLWMVEDAFRSMKSLMATRPIYHQADETILGHVFCSFLALLLRKRLQDLLEERGWHLEWADVVRDLDNLVEMEVSVEGKGYVIRSDSRGVTGKVAQAAGVALPPTLRSCETAEGPG